MPAAIPIIAAVAGYAATTELATLGIGVALLNSGLGLSAGIGIFAGEAISSLGGFLVSTALNAVGSRAFGSSSSQSPAGQPTVSTSLAQMVNSTVETHKIIYGQAKVSGPLVYIGTTNSGPVPHGGPNTGTNLMLHMIVALAGHEVDSIGTVYIDDKPVTIDSNGYVNNMPYSYYPASPTANTKTISTAIRTSEVVTVTTSSSHSFTAGDQVDVAVGSDLSMNGTFIILATPSGTTFTYSNGGPNASASGGSATDNTLSASVNSYIRIKKHTGASGQIADADMISEIPGWDSNHRLQGIAYLYVRLEYNQDVFGRGIPNISAIVNGKKVYDPRSGLTAWSENVALCIRDYLTSDYGFNCDDIEINDTYCSASANTCDESVTLTTGGSQNRYTCDGVIDTANSPVNNLNALVAAMAGTVTYVQGQFRVHAGAFESTVGDITPDMLAGDVMIDARVPRQQLFNAIQGTYIDPSRKYAATDFPQVVNDTYINDDGGTQIFKDIQLPFTNHPEAAQRIAKIILEQGRQGIQLQLTLNHSAIPFAVWDTVTYTDANIGWDHKVFRIKSFATSGIGPIILNLQEEASANYDWAAGEATVIDPAPDTNLPNALVVAVPTGVSYSSRAVTTTGGDTVYNLVMMWNVHSDAFVFSGGRVEIQFKLSSDSAWRPSFFVAGDQGSADILTSSPNVSYDLRIRAVSALGTRSNWTELDAAIIGSSGGAGSSLDWGSVADAVGSSADWGQVADAVGASNDWGSVV